MNRRGFTLLEMLIAMGVTSIVIAVISIVLVKQSQASVKQTQQRSLEETGRQALLEIAYAVRMAGSARGVIYLNGMTPATLTAFDSTTLQRVPASDIALPSAALSAWMQDGELRWVDTSRHLHVGEVVVPGDFICVR